MNPMAWRTTGCMRSDLKVYAPCLPSRLTVQFIASALTKIQIKSVMKISATNEGKKNVPSLFHVAAKLEDPSDPSKSTMTLKPGEPLSQTPFANLMLHPEKLEPALKTTAGTENPKTSPGPARRMPSKKQNSSGAGKTPGQPLVKMEFHLEAPTAKSAKIAGDFTDWEKSALDLTKYKNGIWHVVVPLPPGEYSYRFIVDGQWWDDPHSARRVPNPFGTANAIVTVA